MIVKNKTFDILQLDYPKLLKEEIFCNDNNYGVYLLQFKALHVSIAIEYDRINKCKYLLARCRWCYESNSIVSKRFDFSWNNFIKACHWIDQQRVEFAEQLL